MRALRGSSTLFECSVFAMCPNIVHNFKTPKMFRSPDYAIHRGDLNQIYSEKWWRYLDLNQGPNDYESFALTN